MAAPRRWTYAIKGDLSLYLKIAEAALSSLLKWSFPPTVSRLRVLSAGWMRAGKASVSDVSGIHTARQLKFEMDC